MARAPERRFYRGISRRPLRDASSLAGAWSCRTCSFVALDGLCGKRMPCCPRETSTWLMSEMFISCDGRVVQSKCLMRTALSPRKSSAHLATVHVPPTAAATATAVEFISNGASKHTQQLMYTSTGQLRLPRAQSAMPSSSFTS